MFEEVIRLEGKEKGSTSIVLVGVHGDERCGVEALQKLLPGFQIQRGVVIFGYGNPQAIEKNIRYVETNLNRIFVDDDHLTQKERESYEYRRAQFLKSFFLESEALLDVHASSIPESKSFVICEANAYGIARFLPADFVVSGFDVVEPGGTDFFMNRMGKIGVCLECGYTKDPKSTERAQEGILAFLKARGHILNNLNIKKQSFIKMFEKYFSQTNSFILAKLFENFEEVSAGQIIGIDGQEEVRAPKQSVILFAQNGKNIGDEIFLLGEKKIPA